MKLDITKLDSMVQGAEEALNSAKLGKDASDRETVKYYSEETDNEMIVKFSRIVSGVARKYASKWVSREDLEQVLWVKVLEVVNGCGGVSKTSGNLIATCCYRAAVDFYRKARKDYETNSGSEFEMDKPEGGLEYDESKLVSSNKFRNQSQELYVMIKEVLALFPADSKERKYIEMKLYNAGLMDSELFDTVELPGTPKTHNNVDDKIDFMSLIGYNSKKISGGWINRENKMRQIIHEYLGM